MTDNLFTLLPNPLDYAGALWGWFARLGAVSDESTLVEDFAAGAAQLSACELSQLYLLDEATGRLDLAAQHLPGVLPPGGVASPGADFKNEQLLQYVLGQNRVLNLTELGRSVYDTGFLPSVAVPWQSLLCVPLLGRRKQVSGVLLCACQRATELAGYGASLGK